MDEGFKIQRKDLIVGKVQSLMNKNIINDKTYKGFIQYLQHNKEHNDMCNYWFNTPKKYYNDLFVMLLPYNELDKRNDKSFNRYIVENYYKIKMDYHYIVSYMLVYRTTNIYYVECIETNNIFVFRGLGSLILQQYIKKYKIFQRNKYLLPLFISCEAVEFWSKFFEKNYNIYNKYALKKFEKQLPPHNKYKLDWCYLYDYYDENLHEYNDKHTKNYNKKWVD